MVRMVSRATLPFRVRYSWVRTTQVHLDETGSYLWPLIDGRKTVAQLADCMKQQFGEKAEPLYPRIIKYFQIVESYHFIKFLNQ